MAVFSIEHVKLVGLSATVPSSIERNWDLRHLNDIEKTNLINTTGIKERRIANKETTAADLCLQSARRLMAALTWSPNEIDVLIFVTQTPDYTIPGTSMYIQNALGLSTHCLCLDINQGCAGYVYGLSVIASLMQSGKLKKGLLLVGDTITKTIDQNDLSLTPIFADAGSCTALEFSEMNKEKMFFNLQTDGAGFDKIIIPEGGSRYPEIGSKCYLQMNGQDVFNFGLREVVPNSISLLQHFAVKLAEIDYFVMHQANLLLNETIRKKMGIDRIKTLYSLQEYGNTSCASIPVTIAANGNSVGIPIHGKFLLSGFGVGLSWGSVIVDMNDLINLEVDEY